MKYCSISTSKWSKKILYNKSVLPLLFNCFIFLISYKKIEAISFHFDNSHLKKIAQSEHWKSILHYKRKWWGGVRSEADSPTFFLSAKGYKDPLQELKMDMTQFTRPYLLPLGRKNFHHPQCRFPYRYHFFNNQFFFPYPNYRCPFYESWKKQMNAQDLSLVFASFFPHNPASAFGHSFIKIDNKQPQHLNWGLNFSAFVANNESLFYVLKGVFGGYQGAYSVAPYYQKVQEYNDWEGRDLWEYPLRFNQAELKRFLDHLWELSSNTTFDYYFFDENCSYQLLWPIKLAKLQFDLTNHFTFYVQPIDTVKLVLQLNKKEIPSPLFRPSLKKIFLGHYQQLNSEQQQLVKEIVAEKNVDNKIPTESSEVLDTAISYFNYEEAKEKVPSLKKHLLQTERAKIPTTKKNLDWSKTIAESRPDWQHGSSLLGLSGNNFGLYPQLALGYHDFLDPSHGVLEYSEIKIFNLNTQYSYLNKKWQLGVLDLIHITSLQPLFWYDHHFSWRLGATYNFPSSHFNFVGGVGPSFLFTSNFLTYLLVGAKSDIQSVHAFSEVGAIFQWGKHHLHPFIEANRLEEKFNWDKKLEYAFLIDQNWQLRATGILSHEGQMSYYLGFHAYFM